MRHLGQQTSQPLYRRHRILSVTGISGVCLIALISLSPSVTAATQKQWRIPAGAEMWHPSARQTDVQGPKGRKAPPRKRPSSAVNQGFVKPSGPSESERHLLLAGLLNIMIFGIYGFWARIRSEKSANAVVVQHGAEVGRPGYDLRPVILNRPTGPDPLTMRDDQASLIQPIGKFRAGQNVVVDDDHQGEIGDEDTVAFGAEDNSTPAANSPEPAADNVPVNGGASPLTSSAFKIKNLDHAAAMLKQKTNVGQRSGKVGGPTGLKNAAQKHLVQGAVGLLPPEINQHYQAKPGEKVILTARFDVPLHASGALVVTNKRLMAVYQRHVLELLPPRYALENRRNSVKLRQIEDASVVGANRPSLLVVAAAVAWIPGIGVISALLSLGSVALFFFWTRPELAVQLDSQVTRYYPLSVSDIDRVLRLIEKARQQFKLAA